MNALKQKVQMEFRLVWASRPNELDPAAVATIQNAIACMESMETNPPKQI
jgi:hypothetical protein